MKLSLRNRFLLPTIALVLVAFAVATMVSYLNAGSALEQASEREIVQVANLTGKMLDWWVSDRKRDLANWSEQKLYATALQESFMGQAARKSANELMERLVSNYKYYESINLVNPQGTILAASIYEKVKGINLTDRPYFQEAMKGNLVVSEVLISRSTQKPIFVIAAPIKEGDEIKGALVGVVDLGSFNSAFLSTIKLGETGYAYMFDDKGRLISHPDNAQILKANVGDTEHGREMLARGTGLIIYSHDGVDRAAAFNKVEGVGWTVAVGVDTDELLSAAKRIGLINLALAVGCVLVVGALLMFIATRISGQLKDIAEGLSGGASQVADASAQVAQASQQLAEGSSEQASSLEESSASLEQMAAMTRQNADSAQQADSLMRETNQFVATADSAMKELTTAMQDISAASENTSKIIKTIDEIAFQTNLLALNAAVEAARAGEAGAGFAVVADEVRNLAMRAAEAAKNTASLIEGTVQKVKDGTALVDRTAKNFTEVNNNTSKVGELVGEIAAASKEQAQGIDQVNQAIAQMDKLTQSNAANAEESAASSEEMNAQAASMKTFVLDLVALVQGGEAQVETARRPAPKPAAAPLKRPAAKPRQAEVGGLLQHKAPARPTAPAKTIAAKSSAKPAPATPAAKAIENKPAAARKPEEVIPFDDDDADFESF